MKRFTRNVTCLVIAAIVALVDISPSYASQTILPAPQKISAHVYAWIGPLDAPNKTNQGYRMNLAFVVGEKAVAVIDTGYTEAMANEMLAHIKKITKTPVKYAINTNSQPHRFMGNEVFRREGATIIANAKSAARMDEQGAIFASGIESTLELAPGSVKPPHAPDKIIDSEYKLDLGGVSLVLKDFGAAHTPSETVVEIVDDKVVYAGDILFGERMVAILTDGNIESWIAAYDRLRQFKDVTFIPGHGHPGTLKDFELSTYQYLNALYQHMNKAVADGVDLQSAIDSLNQAPFTKLANFEELSGRNANRAYLEREAAGF